MIMMIMMLLSFSSFFSFNLDSFSSLCYRVDIVGLHDSMASGRKTVLVVNI
jgi:hypothetical protein